MQKSLLSAFTMFGLLAAAPAYATLIGVEVTVEGVNQGTSLEDFGPLSETVVAGPSEFTVDLESDDPTRDYLLDINIEASSIQISLNRNVGVGGLAGYDILFDGLEWFDIPGSTIADIVVGTNTTGADVSLSNVGANGFTLSISNMQIEADTTELISLRVLPNHEVPLPASIFLMGLGLAGMAAGRRRRTH